MMTFTFIRTLLKLPLARKLIEYTGVGLVVFLLTLWLHPAPKPVVIQTTPKTTTVEVPVDHLVTKDVVKYVQDDANAKKLLAENSKLKLQVQQLNETIASASSHGGGTVVTVPTTQVPVDLQPSTPTSSLYEFKDWRLDFVTDTKTSKYALNQKFEILSTSGRNPDGTPVSLVKLFEIGPDEKRTEITNTKTTSVFADNTKAHWHIHPTITAGIAWTSDKQPGGVVGARWLTRGRTAAAEDSSLSLLSPALFINGTVKQAALLPISVNLGRIKHQPFRDLWVSPFIGYDTTNHKTGKVGIVIHASF
jgi:hypothetical protein